MCIKIVTKRERIIRVIERPMRDSDGFLTDEFETIPLVVRRITYKLGKRTRTRETVIGRVPLNAYILNTTLGGSYRLQSGLLLG